MDSSQYHRILDQLRGLVITSQNPLKGECPCPSHDDHKPSMSIGQAADGKLLLNCHGNSGCTTASILKAIGRTFGDLYPDHLRKDGKGTGHKTTAATNRTNGKARGVGNTNGTSPTTRNPEPGGVRGKDAEGSPTIRPGDSKDETSPHAIPPDSDQSAAPSPASAGASRGPRKRDKVVAAYSYHDLQGVLRMQVVKFEPKSFRQRRPLSNGKWDWKAVPAEERILYRWPEFVAATTAPAGDPNRPVFVCYSSDTEVLTVRGWKLLSDLSPADKVAQYCQHTAKVSFTAPSAIQSFEYSGEMINVRADWCDLLVTPDHRQLVKYGRCNPKVVLADSVKRAMFLPVAGMLAGEGGPTPDEARLLVAWIADGVNERRGFKVSWNLKKQRKKDRLRELLSACGVAWTEHSPESTPEWTGFRVKRSDLCSILQWAQEKSIGIESIQWSKEARVAVLDELSHWDGDSVGIHGTRLFTSDRNTADVICAMAAVTDRYCGLRVDRRVNRPRSSDAFVLNINDRNWRVLAKTPASSEYIGKVYCCTVPDGFIVVRRNGKVTVSGNCEGEKDVDRLRASGLTATTNPGGATTKSTDKKWLPQYNEALRGLHCVIIPDQDLPDKTTGRITGHIHAATVANELLPVAASVRVLHLPVIPKLDVSRKWDVSDWLDAGGTRDQFFAALDACPQWTHQDAIPEPTAPVEAEDDPYRLARLFALRDKHPGGLTIRFWADCFWKWEDNRYRPIELSELRARITGFIKEVFDAKNIEDQKANREAAPPKSKRVTCGMVANTILALSAISVLPYHTDQPSWIGEPPDAVEAAPAAEGVGNSEQPAAPAPAAATDTRCRSYLTTASGILNVDNYLETGSGLLISPTPAFFSLSALDYPHVQAATCPTWERFVDRIFAGDRERMNLLQEWFGLCLIPDTTYQRFLLAHGEGANGKSVACAALTALLGEINVSNLSLDDFAGEFGMIQMQGKLLNITAEIAEMERVHEGKIKALVSGDRMTANRKNKSHLPMLPTARLMFATNTLPKFADRSNGIWRRMLLLPFTETIAYNERVLGMDKVAWWRARGELPGMLLWAIEGLRRLRANGDFTFSSAGAWATEEYRDESNPVRMFLKANFYPDPSGEVVNSELYQAYKNWCVNDNHRPLANNIFGREVRRVFPMAEPVKLSLDYSIDNSLITKRVMGYRGIARLPEHECEPIPASPIY